MKDFWHLVGVEELQIVAAVDSNFIFSGFYFTILPDGNQGKISNIPSATAEDEWNLWWT